MGREGGRKGGKDKRREGGRQVGGREGGTLTKEEPKLKENNFRKETGRRQSTCRRKREKIWRGRGDETSSFTQCFSYYMHMYIHVHCRGQNFVLLCKN